MPASLSVSCNTSKENASKMNYKRLWQMLTGLMAVSMLLAGFFQNGAARIDEGEQQSSSALTPTVRYAVRHDASPPLRLLAANAPAAPQPDESSPLRERRILPKTLNPPLSQPLLPDSAVQHGPVSGLSPAVEFNFEGVNNINGVLPPDTNGDVGPNHYMQWVNLSLAIWTIDRNTNTATLALGPVAGNSLWSGFGGACETSNDGDPIVLYDHLADRWMVSQFALPNFPSGPYYQCIAVSQTSDPTGAWYRYAFVASNTKMNDYPHLGVWPDGYYMTVNQFTNGSSWGGAGVFVFERDKMLTGQTARMVYFDLYGVNSNFGGMLPSDLDGDPPPAGTPNYFAEVDDASWLGDPVDTMRIWEFHVDWNNTSNSTFGLNGLPNYTVPVDNFNPITFSIPQPGTGQQLDTIGDRLMHRLQFRNFGTYFTLVTNHTVDAGSVAGVRWYELHKPTNGAWNMYQQGTYAGDSTDGLHRWMASAALDSAGNLAIGYSVASSSVYPSIRYTGRLISDPLGTLPQGEGEIIAGSGAQTSSYGRWGDYSMLGVDPVNGCTFWFTTEYVQSTGSAPWQTRIGSFTFPSCLTGLTGGMSGVVTDASSGAPIAGAQVDADGYTAFTIASGRYVLEDLPVGYYTATVSAYGYYPQTLTNIQVQYAQSTTQNFSLTPRGPITVTGVVRDGSGQGWPLYARIDVSAAAYANTIFTNPQSGAYSLTLHSGLTYTFQVQALSPGYNPATQVFSSTLPNNTLDFALTADSTCSAPGYTGSGTCTAESGGLLLGNVYDANTGAPVNGAALSHGPHTAVSQATTADPAVDDGFYALFVAGGGSQNVAATGSGYAIVTDTVTITTGGVAWHNFTLPAGRLAYAPTLPSATLIPTPTLTTTLVLSNTGSYTLTFTAGGVNAPLPALSADGPFAPATRRASPKHMTDYDAQAVYAFEPPAAARLPGGEVLAQWNAGAARLWGLGFDPRSGLLWTGDALSRRVAALTAAGQPAGSAFDAAFLNGVFPAGMTYDPFGRVFWLLNVGGDDCLYAFDPSAGFTGKSICPNTDNALHGLAFDPLSGTFYAGSWNDSIVYQIAPDGRILRSAATGLNIADLAFNPATGHLFATSNAAAGYDVYVLDVNADFALLGGFDVPGMDAWSQAGAALDCSGALWLADQRTGLVRKTASGETGVCAWQAIPWLTISPASGSLPAGASQPITLTFDAAGVTAGTYQAYIKVTSDTPYGATNIPVSLTVNPAYGVSVTLRTAPQAAYGGQSVQYSVEVSNTGNTGDLYDITLSGNAWASSAPPTIGMLSAGASDVFALTVTVPVGTLEGSDQVLVSVTSRGDATQSASVQVTTTAKAYHLFLPVSMR